MTDGVGIGEGTGIGVIDAPKKIDNLQQKPVATLEDKLGQGTLATLAKAESVKTKGVKIGDVSFDDLFEREASMENFSQRSIDRVQAESLMALSLNKFRQECIRADNFPHDQINLDKLDQLQARTSILFLKYAQASDLSSFRALFMDGNELVRSRSAQLLAEMVPLRMDIFAEARDDLLRIIGQKMKTGEDPKFLKTSVNAIIENWYGCMPAFLRELASIPFDDKTQEIISKIAEKNSFLGTVKNLRALLKEVEDPAQRGNIERMITYLEPDQEKQEVVESLAEIYKKINFEDYPINEKALNADAGILEKVFTSRDGDLLDLGCGAGRLLKVLHSRGYKKLHGVDIARRHVELTKEKVPDADIAQASWYNLPYTKEALDGIYCLGRSILHNETYDDYRFTFREVWNTLKRDGVFIVDIPDITQGEYAEKVKSFVEEAKAKGIETFGTGLIYDSPDGNHFYNRFALSQEQMEALAKLTGFKIREVIPMELPDGKGDVNLYYVLEKDANFNSASLSGEEHFELMSKFLPPSFEEWFEKSNLSY